MFYNSYYYCLRYLQLNIYLSNIYVIRSIIFRHDIKNTLLRAVLETRTIYYCKIYMIINKINTPLFIKITVKAPYLKLSQFAKHLHFKFRSLARCKISHIWHSRHRGLRQWCGKWFVRLNLFYGLRCCMWSILRCIYINKKDCAHCTNISVKAQLFDALKSQGVIYLSWPSMTSYCHSTKDWVWNTILHDFEPLSVTAILLTTSTP